MTILMMIYMIYMMILTVALAMVRTVKDDRDFVDDNIEDDTANDISDNTVDVG